MLTLYTYWRSSASYRVRLALSLKGLEYESRFIHLLKGEHTAAAYRKINPQGRVPTLIHDGQVLTQSLAIIEYLDERFPSVPLMPRDPAGRARVRSLSHIITSEIQPLQNLATAEFLKVPLGCTPDQIDAWRVHWISSGLDALEARLAHEPDTGDFAHGSTPTMADCCIVPQAYAARRFGIQLEKYPTIARIDAACAELGTFQRAAPESQGDRA